MQTTMTACLSESLKQLWTLFRCGIHYKLNGLVLTVSHMHLGRLEPLLWQRIAQASVLLLAWVWLLALRYHVRSWREWRLESWKGGSCRWNHLEFVHDFYSPAHIQCKGSKSGLNVDFTLLTNLVLSYNIKVSETLVHKRSHVSCFLKNLSVCIIIDECEKLVKNALNVCNFLKIACDHWHFSKQSLFFSSKLLFKFSLQLQLFLIKFPVQIGKALVYVL